MTDILQEAYRMEVFKKTLFKKVASNLGKVSSKMMMKWRTMTPFLDLAKDDDAV